ncbi:hypothetical protein Tco_0109487 [Tanacetum coccineum]
MSSARGVLSGSAEIVPWGCGEEVETEERGDRLSREMREWGEGSETITLDERLEERIVLVGRGEGGVKEIGRATILIRYEGTAWRFIRGENDLLEGVTGETMKCKSREDEWTTEMRGSMRDGRRCANGIEVAKRRRETRGCFVVRERVEGEWRGERGEMIWREARGRGDWTREGGETHERGECQRGNEFLVSERGRRSTLRREEGSDYGLLEVKRSDETERLDLPREQMGRRIGVVGESWRVGFWWVERVLGDEEIATVDVEQWSFDARERREFKRWRYGTLSRDFECDESVGGEIVRKRVGQKMWTRLEECMIGERGLSSRGSRESGRLMMRLGDMREFCGAERKTGRMEMEIECEWGEGSREREARPDEKRASSESRRRDVGREDVLNREAQWRGRGGGVGRVERERKVGQTGVRAGDAVVEGMGVQMAGDGVRDVVLVLSLTRGEEMRMWSASRVSGGGGRGRCGDSKLKSRVDGVRSVAEDGRDEQGRDCRKWWRVGSVTERYGSVFEGWRGCALRHLEGVGLGGEHGFLEVIWYGGRRGRARRGSGDDWLES